MRLLNPVGARVRIVQGGVVVEEFTLGSTLPRVGETVTTDNYYGSVIAIDHLPRAHGGCVIDVHISTPTR